MKTKHSPRRNSFRGFSLMELLVVVAMISIVLSAILTQVEQVQQRATAEQGKVDDFQEARDFLAQVIRDARQMGYPNFHNFDTTAGAWQSPLMNDSRLAIGLVKLTSTQLQFEGDVNSSGTVSVVSYAINGDGACANCMERAQVAKVNGNPLTGQTNLAASSYVQEVQNVQNASSITAPVFSAYDAAGNAIPLPVNISTDPTHTAEVRLIKINLAVASPTSVDPKTRKQLEADISGDVQVVNCSMATTNISVNGFLMTCQ